MASRGSKAAARSQGGESALSIRFKHGTHTVFLFVDPSAPFSNITAELLNILRSRWPEGLSVSNRRPDLTVVPDEDEDIRVSYAVLKNPRDNNSGWKNLRITGTETPASKNLKDNMVVVFAIQEEDATEEPEFYVEFPAFEDDEGDVSE